MGWEKNLYARGASQITRATLTLFRTVALSCHRYQVDEGARGIQADQAG